jgi:hypothetical protein
MGLPGGWIERLHPEDAIRIIDVFGKTTMNLL